MNRTQLEHIIRAASNIAADSEIVVIGSRAIHAQDSMNLPPIVFQSEEADVYPRNYPERAEDIDAAIGELSPFHEMHGYYAHGVSPETARLPEGWEHRLIRLSSSNTGGATGFCLDVHDLVLSKYAASREKDREFNRAVVRYGGVGKKMLLTLVRSMPVDDDRKEIIVREMAVRPNPGKNDDDPGGIKAISRGLRA
ncbi:MAG: hypothetical protein P4L43_17560 [Syntrophobacteraceae bacterium]|nr:hypothetical protein [Syntrophobacteraceae bacterium]